MTPIQEGMIKEVCLLNETLNKSDDVFEKIRIKTKLLNRMNFITHTLKELSADNCQLLEALEWVLLTFDDDKKFRESKVVKKVQLIIDKLKT